MRRALVAAFVMVGIVASGSGARAQDRGEAHGSLRVFAQPVSSDWLLVLTPTVTGKVTARPWLSFDVDWSADVVTGATPRTYGSPDVVTAATQFTEVRNSIGAGAAATVGPATITAGYAYGTENDYRSHLIRAGVTLDLAHHDTTSSPTTATPSTASAISNRRASRSRCASRSTPRAAASPASPA